MDGATSTPATRLTTTDHADVARAIQTVAAAFEHDPVLAWLIPPGRRRRLRAIERYFAIELARWGVRRHSYATAHQESVSIWYSPEEGVLQPGEIVSSLPQLLKTLGKRTLPAMRGISVIERERPTEPHWYLHGLGTRPEAQGRGLAAAVMQPGLAKAGAAGLGCYLEASHPLNVPFYERFGFTVQGSGRLPGGPEWWPMWRPPQDV